MTRWCLVALLAASLAAEVWGCGGVLSGSGTFTSPGYPSNYPVSSFCSWVIAAESGKVVYLSFSAFELETGANCVYDYVKVYSGPSSASPAIGTFCGIIVTAAITSSSNVITVQFKSDSSLSYKGFSAAFQSVEAGDVPTTAKPADSCGGDFTSETGIIFSPNYPNLYPNSASCSYLIGVPAGRVVLTFLMMDVQSSPSCTYDRIEVRDGNATGTLLYTLCGNTLPGKIIVSGRFLHVKFVSDSSIQQTGFQAKWEVLTCETKGGRCESSCDGRTNSTLPCSSAGAVCCFPTIQTSACGVQPSSEIAGDESVPQSWPWLASLQLSNSNFHFCGATIITPEWLVTAAHCVNGTPTDSVHVVVGEQDLTKPDHEQVLRIQSYIMNEEYDQKGDGFQNDIALIKLRSPIQFNRYVQPACLPEFDDEFIPGECFIKEWGNTQGTIDGNVIKQLKVGVITGEECVNKWKLKYINGGHICIVNGVIGAYNNDTDGPLVCEKKLNGRKRWVLVGTQSFGILGFQTKEYPNVYTKINYFLPWIEATISEHMYRSK